MQNSIVMFTDGNKCWPSLPGEKSIDESRRWVKWYNEKPVPGVRPMCIVRLKSIK